MLSPTVCYNSKSGGDPATNQLDVGDLADQLGENGVTGNDAMRQEPFRLDHGNRVAPANTARGSHYSRQAGTGL